MFARPARPRSPRRLDDALTPAPPSDARSAIARSILGASRSAFTNGARVGARLGAITLRAHQLDAVARLRTLLAEAGGALLADAVGMGKTYVALALVRDARRPLVVAPAALRDVWRRAMSDAGVHAPLISFETLSRRGSDARPGALGRQSGDGFDLVVVDEAHHARNPATRRYHALAGLTVGARVLLLSATPVHNRRADLAALLALFLGRRAHALDDEALARFVVRRDRDALPQSGRHGRLDRIPAVAAPVVLRLPADDAVPDAILALPPPLPPRDGEDGGVLVAHSLVRQWASSDAALRSALRRRLARARAIESSLDRGVHPSLAELRAWTSDGESQQLVLAELLAPPGERVTGADALRDAVASHAAAVRGLLATLGSDDARDDARAALLRNVCARHPGERVVAFASYAQTVRSLFTRLSRVVPTAALSGEGGVVAGGALTRSEALARFAPLACGAPPPRPAERVELLLTTDILSEGVSLLDASVVVHLDMPWTPARLEQRVGRAARLGAPHSTVTVYAVAPPASAEAALRIERHLREKLRSAGRVVGVSGTILPGAAALASAPSAAGSAEEARRVLERWRGEGGSRESIVAALRCGTSGFVAACRSPSVAGAAQGESPPFLVAALDDGDATDDVRVVHRAVSAASEGEATPVLRSVLSLALGAIERWAARRAASVATGISDGAAIRVRRRVIGRIAAIARRLPAHRRGALAPLAASARRAALAPFGAGAEWVLEELSRADLPDEAWLRAVRAFGESAVAGAKANRDASTGDGVEVVALILLRP